jgi:hypothetical protein
MEDELSASSPPTAFFTESAASSDTVTLIFARLRAHHKIKMLGKWAKWLADEVIEWIGGCPLLALSVCFWGVKRTCPFALHMSANDPKRTSVLQKLLLCLNIEYVQNRALGCGGASTFGNRFCQQPFQLT